MASQGEVSLQEIFALVETAREYLGPMWVKKSMKQAANLPVKGIINRKQLASVHPLGLLFREVEKNQETLDKGKPLAHAANLLLLAGLGRNLKSLADAPGFDHLVTKMKTPATFTDAALLAEVSAHWQKLGYSTAIISGSDDGLQTIATNTQTTFYLLPTSYTFFPGKDVATQEPLLIPDNFIYSQWWENWTTDAAGKASARNPEVADILNSIQQKHIEAGTILYLDLPPYTTQEIFLPVLATVADHLQTRNQFLSAVILCLPQHLPHLYVRHTLPVYAEAGSHLLSKSLLNTLSY